MITLPKNFNVDLTLDCGQAFRWKKDGDTRSAVVKDVQIRLRQNDENIFFDNTADEFDRVIRPYFDFDRDYDEIIARISQDKAVSEVIARHGVIRILHQDSFEALISFIISACNNIPRIKGIVAKMCELYGTPAGTDFAFPTPEALAVLDENDLAPLHAGYRTPYILDAARRVAEGQTDLDKISAMPIADARAELMKICGVGRKVADCTLLFGMNRLDVFPVDRHIKRITGELYGADLPDCFSPYSGIAQQYLFVKQAFDKN